MGQWKVSPQEIALQIVDDLRAISITHQEEWTIANRQLYTLNQSLEFKIVSIDLDNNYDITVDAFSTPFFNQVYGLRVSLYALFFPYVSTSSGSSAQINAFMFQRRTLNFQPIPAQENGTILDLLLLTVIYDIYTNYPSLLISADTPII
jgi:hypothetical protein